MSVETKTKSSYLGHPLPPLLPGILKKRYKRFLADVELETGDVVIAHCPNSGSMKGCSTPGSRVYLSRADNPKRKLAYTWELLETPKTLVGINTQVPNKLVKNAIKAKQVKGLNGYDYVTAEVKTSEHTRLDLVLEKGTREKCYVEIKNCTLMEDGCAMFPDAVTTRGKKHLEELETLVANGHRGVIFYLIQRMDARCFKPAESIDSEYAKALRKAVENGVEIMVMDTVIDTKFICLGKVVPYSLE
ncbi:MAG: DNA/RNA nuclease SfsA [Desulfobacteraceae bacterium]|nr:DNA/RNA nuclease SfsA [Desulfobacteraceae bacterium]